MKGFLWQRLPFDSLPVRFGIGNCHHFERACVQLGIVPLHWGLEKVNCGIVATLAAWVGLVLCSIAPFHFSELPVETFWDQGPTEYFYFFLWFGWDEAINLHFLSACRGNFVPAYKYVFDYWWIFLGYFLQVSWFIASFLACLT
jgi:hypothetical protein